MKSAKTKHYPYAFENLSLVQQKDLPQICGQNGGFAFPPLLECAEGAVIFSDLYNVLAPAAALNVPPDAIRSIS